MRSGILAGLSLLLPLCLHARAQTTAGSSADASATVTQAAVAPSGLVQPSLGTVEQALELVLIDRWKASKATKETATANLGSIHRDLETSLPGLLAKADQAPGSLAAMLPALQNLGALYDVLLRVAVVAEAAAPSEQVAALGRALTSLEGGRRALTERLQTTAGTSDRRVTELQAALSARPTAVTSAVVAPPSCKPMPAARPKKKPAAKPAG